jgi:hypothetical protein
MSIKGKFWDIFQHTKPMNGLICHAETIRMTDEPKFYQIALGD